MALDWLAFAVFGGEELLRTLGPTAYGVLTAFGGAALAIVVVAVLWGGPLAVVFLFVRKLAEARVPARRRRTALAGTAAVAVVMGLHVLPLDGWPGALWPFLGDETQFASGYSPLGFWRVKEGMSPQQVASLVGEPLERYGVAGGGEGWRWSRSPNDGSYRVRVVIFRGGLVEFKRSAVYLD